MKMWKYKKGEVVFVKASAYWGHVIGFAEGNDETPRIKVELETGQWFLYWPNELETEVDQ